MNLIAPKDLGFSPSRFPEFRRSQIEVGQKIADSKKRFVALCAPPGAGKTVIYMAVSRLLRKADPSSRSIFLTGLKGLQEQIGREFGVRLQMGMSNYQCVIQPEFQCDKGVCKIGVRCDKMESGCLYFDAARAARVAAEVSTNYAYWLHINAKSQGGGLGGGIKFLALDEAHDAPKHLASFLRVELNDQDLGKHSPRAFMRRPNADSDCLVGDWRGWAKTAIEETEPEYIKLGRMIEQSGASVSGRVKSDFKHLKELRTGLMTIETELDESWAWEKGRYGAIFEPLNPGKFSESLFCGIPKILLTSATLTKKGIEKLGVKEEEVEFIELDSDFPQERRPIIYIPIKLSGATVRVKYGWSKLEERMWLNMIDSIVESRLGFKGLIHTTSYARARLILESSKWRDYMVSHDSGGTQKAVEGFKNSKDPIILVTPTVIEGYDFPGDQCRYQIIAKLPFPDLQGRIAKKRAEVDKGTGMFMMAQNLVQAAGRVMRGKEDWGETFIIDGQWEWARGTASSLLPRHFRAACQERKAPGVAPNF